jgi:hypothetical protein
MRTKIKLELTNTENYVLGYVLNEALRTFDRKAEDNQYYSNADFVAVLTPEELRALKKLARRV